MVDRMNESLPPPDSAAEPALAPTAASNDAAETDRQTQARLEEIESQIKRDQPLTSNIRPLVESLEPEYRGREAAANFLSGVRALGKSYDRLRFVRGDGNCYYRAFLYRLAESIMSIDQKEKGASSAAAESDLCRFAKEDLWNAILAAGYDRDMLEIFHESFVELLEKVEGGQCDADQLHELLNEENSTSDYCTWFLRVVTAVHLKANAERFLPFMEGGIDVDTFCKASVEPMGKECENVQVLALAEALGIRVVIAYLDGHDLVGGNVTQHEFGPSDGTHRAKLCFLYRPGHYDILYPR